MKIPCMLSEFDRPLVRWLFKGPGPVLWAPLLVFVWALLTWLLGHLAGVNGMALHFLLERQDNQQQLALFTHVFGYMGELNHGWFYVIGLPIFLLLWFRCMISLSKALESLVTKSRLLIVTKRPLLTKAGRVIDPIQIIAVRNRKCMNPVFILAVPFFIIWVLTQFWCSLGTRGTVAGIDDESVISPKLLS